MNNNDYVIRLRYALDIKDEDLLIIFGLGGVSLELTQLRELLKRQETDDNPEEKLATHDLEAFLNGLIIWKRGVKPGVEPTFIMTTRGTVNNVFLKKVKIALGLTSDDLQDIFKLAKFKVSNSELTDLLRKKGHRNYKPAGNQFVRNFLQGLTAKYR
jgi:uncharacterized protein YehS (DUF1456 family)